jgi:hypothetical protein
MSSKIKGRATRRAPHTVASKSIVDDGLLDVREKTHGGFADVARVAQALRTVLRSGPSWARMTDVHREALDSKATKLARIVCGDVDHIDHWRDDIGYSQLARGGGNARSKSDGR